jgi:IPT/TIG domain
MTIRDADNNVLSKTDLMALATPRPAPEPEYTIDANVYETYRYGKETEFEAGRRLLFRAGRVVKQSDIDRLYNAAAVTTVAPASGPAAGGTVVTINGSNLGGVEAVTFGGTAATNVQVVSQTQVRATTPAHAAGLVDVVVSDDSGDITKSGGFTFV